MSQTDENQTPLLDRIHAENLTELARKRFAYHLSDAELRVLRDSAISRDPYQPQTNAPRPEIRPELVRWLASDPEAVPFIDPKGIRVLGITLPRVLNLAHCHITVPLDFRVSTIKGGINLQSAVTRDIYLWDCSVEGAVEADGIDAHGPIFLRGSRFSGEVRLGGAQVKGDLDCRGAKLVVEEENALDADGAEIGGNVFLIDGFESSGTIRLHGAQIKGDLDCTGAKLDVKEGDALFAECAVIGGNVLLSESFTSSGTIRLPGARINGDFDCRGARLKVEEGDALVAYGAEIGGNVLMSGGFECSGRIWLLGARIGGLLTFWGAQVAKVECRNLQISTDLFWIGIRKTIYTSLDLTGVKVKNLREDKASWPDQGHLHLDGLVYEEVTLHRQPTTSDIERGRLTEELELNVKERVGWLMLQPEKRRTEADPWMQLSKHLEGKGNRKGAKHVVYRYRCLLAKENSLPAWRWLRIFLKIWHIAFALLEEVPLRICWSIALTLALGTLIFAGADRSGAMFPSVQIQPNAILPDGRVKLLSIHYPPFQPLVYTLENAVPLVKLGMDEKWMPDPKHDPVPWFPLVCWLNWLKWFNSYWFLMVSRWGLILGGWVQATILAASVADRFRK
jgi:hypothetical protein